MRSRLGVFGERDRPGRSCRRLADKSLYLPQFFLKRSIDEMAGAIDPRYSGEGNYFPPKFNSIGELAGRILSGILPSQLEAMRIWAWAVRSLIAISF
jgi:hypothetical protein